MRKALPLGIRILAFIGCVSIAILVVSVLSAVAMTRAGFSTRSPPSAVERFLARTMRSLAASGARSLQAPRDANLDLAEARVHWASHCAICHGVDGSGDTDIGRKSFPPAPDMRSADVQQQTDGELYSSIKNGIRLTGMPAWGDPGDDDLETWALVAFIRTLPTLDDASRDEIRRNLPTTPHERAEDAEEDDFLRGGSAPTHPEYHP